MDLRGLQRFKMTDINQGLIVDYGICGYMILLLTLFVLAKF